MRISRERRHAAIQSGSRAAAGHVAVTDADVAAGNVAVAPAVLAVSSNASEMESRMAIGGVVHPIPLADDPRLQVRRHWNRDRRRSKTENLRLINFKS